jgi:hypothetical protein
MKREVEKLELVDDGEPRCLLTLAVCSKLLYGLSSATLSVTICIALRLITGI